LVVAYFVACLLAVLLLDWLLLIGCSLFRCLIVAYFVACLLASLLLGDWFLLTS
jgi:hypothetical protein